MDDGLEIIETGSRTSESSRSDGDFASDEKIEVIRQRSVKCQSSFVTLKHSVMYLTCDKSSVDKKSVQETVEEMLVAQETSVNMLTELSELYSEKGKVDMMEKVSEDMELIHKDSYEAQCAAFSFVKAAISATVIDSEINGKNANDIDTTIEMLQGQLSKLQDECDGYKQMLSERSEVQRDQSSCNNQNDETQKLGSDLWNQLERVSIPVFDGDKMTYEGWRAAFDSCVDKAPVSPVYKLLQLKKYLSGEPLCFVQRLGHSANAYELAKSKLDRKYGGKRRQNASYLQQLQQFKDLTDGDPKSFEDYADLLEMAVFTLRESGRTTLLKKLSDRMMVEYLRWTVDKKITESVESLAKWALTESEYRVISSETREGLNGSSSQKTYFVANRTDGSKYVKDTDCRNECVMCHEVHSIEVCPVFLSLSSNDRWEAARRNGLCFRCLRGKQVGKDCQQWRYSYFIKWIVALSTLVSFKASRQSCK